MDDSIILQFAKEDVASMCLELVKDIAQQIIDVEAKKHDILGDDSLSRNEIQIQIKDLYDEMTSLWSKLGKARLLARKLYPEAEILFDVLDKAVDVNATISGICSRIEQL